MLRRWRCDAACRRSFFYKQRLDDVWCGMTEIKLTKVGIPSRRGCRPGTVVALNLHKKHPREYQTWGRIRSRCRNKKSPDWPLYGGRGIKVCDRWKSFASFLEDMGERPSDKHSIDRIDGNGNYEPGNCRWSTSKEQARNWTTRNHLLTLGDETMCISAWTERLGFSGKIIRDRLDSGWTVEKTLTTPVIRDRERLEDGTFAPVGD